MKLGCISYIMVVWYQFQGIYAKRQAWYDDNERYSSATTDVATISHPPGRMDEPSTSISDSYVENRMPLYIKPQFPMKDIEQLLKRVAIGVLTTMFISFGWIRVGSEVSKSVNKPKKGSRNVESCESDERVTEESMDSNGSKTIKLPADPSPTLRQTVSEKINKSKTIHSIYEETYKKAKVLEKATRLDIDSLVPFIDKKSHSYYAIHPDVRAEFLEAVATYDQLSTKWQHQCEEMVTIVRGKSKTKCESASFRLDMSDQMHRATRIDSIQKGLPNSRNIHNNTGEDQLDGAAVTLLDKSAESSATASSEAVLNDSALVAQSQGIDCVSVKSDCQWSSIESLIMQHLKEANRELIFEIENTRGALVTFIFPIYSCDVATPQDSCDLMRCETEISSIKGVLNYSRNQSRTKKADDLKALYMEHLFKLQERKMLIEKEQYNPREDRVRSRYGDNEAHVIKTEKIVEIERQLQVSQMELTNALNTIQLIMKIHEKREHIDEVARKIERYSGISLYMQNTKDKQINDKVLQNLCDRITRIDHVMGEAFEACRSLHNNNKLTAQDFQQKLKQIFKPIQLKS